MKKIVFFLSLGIIGVMLNSMGYGYSHWQFWVIGALISLSIFLDKS